MKKSMPFVFLLTLLAVGCTGGSPENDAQILGAITANLKAMEQEDVNATMATIDPSSGGYEMTKEMIKVIFEQYDLKYELSDLKVLKRSDKEAEVGFTQITRKVAGPDFRDNKITGVHILKKNNGVWRIFSSQIKSTEYLD